MLLSLRKNGPTSLFKEVRVFKVIKWVPWVTRVGGVMCVKGHHLDGAMCSWVITKTQRPGRI